MCCIPITGTTNLKYKIYTISCTACVHCNMLCHYRQVTGSLPSYKRENIDGSSFFFMWPWCLPRASPPYGFRASKWCRLQQFLSPMTTKHNTISWLFREQAPSVSTKSQWLLCSSPDQFFLTVLLHKDFLLQGQVVLCSESLGNKLVTWCPW